jgi:hypothetical protein
MQQTQTVPELADDFDSNPKVQFIKALKTYLFKEKGQQVYD